jgi:ClpP class serine protease
MLGEQALGLGLIDGFSTVDDLVKQLGGDRARARRIAPKKSRLLGRLPRLALDLLLDALEDRSWRIEFR